MPSICLFLRINCRTVAPHPQHLYKALTNIYRMAPQTAKLSSSSTCHERYEEAISALNSLQSNAQTLEQIRKKRDAMATQSLPSTEKYLKRVDIDQDSLKKLSIIHVAGTKGKGSTCAFVESLLSEHGLKVGLYTSPHLVVARERIRIGRRIISEQLFTSHFWDVYNALDAQKSSASDMPSYFKFLTVLALKVFLKEQVDVAVLEVGIGGEYDCTNVVREPTVCGITSLDLDHTSMLGNTIESIAWHKAGIMKKNVTTFTTEQQSASSYQVLQQRSIEKKCPLLIAPPLEEYDSSGEPLKLGLSGAVQFNNASLALQLSNHWLRKHSNLPIPQTFSTVASAFPLSEEDRAGLRNVVWPGRSQIISEDSLTYFIDGAHTKLSILACINWFKTSSEKYYSKQRPTQKILLFNITGDRDPKPFLESLAMLDFDQVLFSTNLATKDVTASSDQKTVGVSESSQINKCHALKTTWDVHQAGRKMQQKVPSLVFECVKDAMDWIEAFNNTPSQPKVQVLVTGSLHLVGAFLAVLDPSLTILEKTYSPRKSLSDVLKNRQSPNPPATP